MIFKLSQKANISILAFKVMFINRENGHIREFVGIIYLILALNFILLFYLFIFLDNFEVQGHSFLSLYSRFQVNNIW